MKARLLCVLGVAALAASIAAPACTAERSILDKAIDRVAECVLVYGDGDSRCSDEVKTAVMICFSGMVMAGVHDKELMVQLCQENFERKLALGLSAAGRFKGR
jgi:hypothetical protein